VRVRRWIWDERNRAHIARHGVYEDEAEEVVATATLTEVIQAGKSLAWGKTAEGRYLLVVYAIRGQQGAYVITARDMTSKEKKRFRRLFGRKGNG